MVGCEASRNRPLPTLNPTAAVAIHLTPSPSPTIDPSHVPPPTWTAQPGATTTINTDTLQTLAPTLTPSVTPVLPTRTPTPTTTPTPSATPEPVDLRLPTLPPTNELGPSKLGLHVITNNDPRIMEFVRQADPAIMKGVGDLGFLAEVKRVSPRVITIGRIDDIFSQNYIGNPEEAARDYVNSQLPQYLANPAVDYWEGWNEPDPNLDRMWWYTRFEQERTRLMASYGFRVAIGGFPAGVPEMDEFLLFVPAIETAIEHGGILSLHEGGAPTINASYGSALPGYPYYPDRGSLAFRYRWYYREILEPAGLVIPLIISELGIDGVINTAGQPGPPARGWRDFEEYWVELGLGSTGIEAYINQLNWYDVEARRDGYVIGFTVFTAGGGERWRTYDVNDIIPQLTAYVNSQR